MSLAARVRLLRPAAARPLALTRSLVATFALAALIGCSGEATSSDSAALAGTDIESTGSKPGWLLVDWSIAGGRNVEQCDSSHSATVAVSVSAADGTSQGIHQETCFAFNATISLAPGDYAARAVLLDGAGNDLTSAVELQPFEIVSGVPSRIPLEFPASAFYSR